ncbi:MAG: MarR family transcriptional regulator [Anaerolineaceae bacterium]|nr:MarR family transcriptional regulator [Anaerolineaceae bacterium]
MPTHFEGDERTKLALDTFIKFTRAAGAFESRLLHRGQLGDLTLSQFGVLETLHHLGPLCPGQISAKLLKSSGNITLVLDNLEKQGLVQRVRDTEDRRKITLTLTPAGEAVITEVFPRQAAVIADEMSALTPAEQETLGRLCKKLGLGASESPDSIVNQPNPLSVS